MIAQVCDHHAAFRQLLRRFLMLDESGGSRSEHEDARSSYTDESSAGACTGSSQCLVEREPYLRAFGPESKDGQQLRNTFFRQELHCTHNH